MRNVLRQENLWGNEAKKLTILEMRWKSSMAMATEGSWQERLMAIRCKTAFVEPPVTITMRIAFSNAALVIMSRGFMSFSNKIFKKPPASMHSPFFSCESAGEDEEYGSDMPVTQKSEIHTMGPCFLWLNEKPTYQVLR